eukprot:3669367-Ditylum_brightwellii.AAC.1
MKQSLEILQNATDYSTVDDLQGVDVVSIFLHDFKSLLRTSSDGKKEKGNITYQFSVKDEATKADGHQAPKSGSPEERKKCFTERMVLTVDGWKGCCCINLVRRKMREKGRAA